MVFLSSCPVEKRRGQAREKLFGKEGRKGLTKVSGSDRINELSERGPGAQERRKTSGKKLKKVLDKASRLW